LIEAEYWAALAASIPAALIALKRGRRRGRPGWKSLVVACAFPAVVALDGVRPKVLVRGPGGALEAIRVIAVAVSTSSLILAFVRIGRWTRLAALLAAVIVGALASVVAIL